MGARYLLDTNCPIDLFHDRLPSSGKEWVIDVINTFNHGISVITQIELLGFATVETETRVMEEFVGSSLIYSIGEDVIAKTIALKKKHKIKLPDAVIAATALVHNLILVTRNTKDFENIEGLNTVNPHDK